MISAKAWAWDIAVKNEDGVYIFYNYINDGKDLEVTEENQYSHYYSGNVVIPEEVTYMNRTRKVTSIGRSAFSGCSGLKSITIPNSVTSIGRSAFSGCSGLKSITIPNSVTSIGEYAFYHCSGLTSITIPNCVTSIDEWSFSGCSGLTSVTISNSVTSIGRSAFADCYGLTSITIPNSVTSIGSAAFSKCTSLTSVTIPNSVTSIGGDAFSGCSSLTSVTIPNSVKSINYSTFSNCRGLTSVTIGNSVTSIGQNAFEFCSGLTSITIPNCVKYIGGRALLGCFGLTSIAIPNSVTSIGDGAFDGCYILNVVSLIENPFRIDESTFSRDTYYNATLYVPVGTIDKYKATEGWKTFAFIEEGTIGGGGEATIKKCEKPTIGYSNGKLTFACSTEGASCQYNITDTDIKAGSGNEIQLSVTYEISVYATKEGYENSETATATLCWIDVEPKTEGITDGIANVPAHALLIQNYGGTINVQGADDGTSVSVYTLDGKQVGRGVSHNGAALIDTNIQPGSTAIVKIGNKSVKFVVK